MLLSLLTASSLAFAPNLVPVSQPSLAAMRSSTISASVIEGPSTRRAALFSAGGAAAAFLPAAALALTDEETKAIYDAEKAKYKKTAEAEQNKESDTFKLVAVISHCSRVAHHWHPVGAHRHLQHRRQGRCAV